MSTISNAKSVIQYILTHPANRRKRIRALAKAIIFQARGRVLNSRTLARLGEESRVWAEPGRSASSKVLYANPPDYPEMLMWRAHLRPGDLFLDIGANVGVYSIWAGELGAEVIAMEPAEDTFALLVENIDLNDHNVKPIRAAAGATCGPAQFTAGLDCANRLDPDNVSRDPSTTVEMVTIDAIIQDQYVAGMKIDVEGFELEVLRGCEQALNDRRIGLMQLEWNSTSETAVGTDRAPVKEFLSKYGYDLFRPESNGSSLAPVYNADYGTDVFAKPRLPAGPK